MTFLSFQSLPFPSFLPIWIIFGIVFSGCPLQALNRLHKFSVSRTELELIENEEDFTPSHLIELEKKHKPERIIIEYNGIKEGHIFRTAGHSHPSRHKKTFREIFRLQHHSRKLHFFSDIPLQMIQRIQGARRNYNS